MTEPTQWALEIANKYAWHCNPPFTLALALDAARQQGYREAIVNCERQLHGVVQRATEMLAASASPAPGLHQRAQDFTEAASIIRALTPEDKTP